MIENENPHSGDITDLFKQRILSGEQYGSIYFLENLRKLQKEGMTSQSIKINASDLPAGSESNICNFLKAFLQDNPEVSKQVVITGTQEQYDYLIAKGCANALASGVQFEKIE